MAATVVWCNKCKTAVWAYDQMREGQDIRGFANMASLPCPKCGVAGNFDGWSSQGQILEEIQEIATEDHPVYDWWSALREIFRINVKDGIWAISPDCTWFHRPEEEMETYKFPDDLTEVVSNLIQERYQNNLSVKALRE